MRRMLHIKFGGMHFQKLIDRSFENIKVRANELGLSFRSVTDHTITVQAPSLNAFYRAKQF